MTEPWRGAGLGLRRALLAPLLQADTVDAPDFLELAPENWIGIGGAAARQLRAVAERWPLVAHGLSLSIGGPAPLDVSLITALREFLDALQIQHYSEHLSYCSDGAQLYELLPMPFTADAVHYVAARIREVQERLQRRIALENISYYASLGGELSEQQFVCAVLEEADCDLLLDINNVWVNSLNHGYDPLAFITALPAARLRYLHVAGHQQRSPSLCVDSHGSAVIAPVWELLAAAYRHFGTRATLLERDFDLPPLSELLAELQQIRQLQVQA